MDGKPAKPKRPMPYKGQDVTPAQKSEIGRSAKSKPNPSVPTKNKNEVPNIIVIDSRLNAMDKPPRPLSTSLITPETHDSKSVPSSPQAIHKHPPVMSTPSTPQPHHKVKVTRSVSQEPAKPVKPVPKRTAVEKSISSISPSASSSPHAGSRAALLLKGAIGNLSNSLGSISPIKTQSSRNDASTSKKQHSTECSTSVSNDIPKVTKVLNNSKAINNTYARPRPVPPRPPLRKDENEDEEGYVAVASSTSDSPYDYCEVRKFTHIDKEASANQETSDKSSPQVAPSTTNYTSIDVATMDPDEEYAQVNHNKLYMPLRHETIVPESVYQQLESVPSNDEVCSHKTALISDQESKHKYMNVNHKQSQSISSNELEESLYANVL